MNKQKITFRDYRKGQWKPSEPQNTIDVLVLFWNDYACKIIKDLKSNSMKGMIAFSCIPNFGFSAFMAVRYYIENGGFIDSLGGFIILIIIIPILMFGWLFPLTAIYVIPIEMFKTGYRYMEDKFDYQKLISGHKEAGKISTSHIYEWLGVIYGSIRFLISIFILLSLLLATGELVKGLHPILHSFSF